MEVVVEGAGAKKIKQDFWEYSEARLGPDTA
jgi:hypothetical protein